MADSIIQFWKLDNPDHCRAFLKQAHLDGKPITTLTTESGKDISIDEASDEQVMEVAKWFSDAMKSTKKGH